MIIFLFAYLQIGKIIVLYIQYYNRRKRNGTAPKREAGHTEDKMGEHRYKRILIKLSGEALANGEGHGIDFDNARKVCEKIKICAENGTQVAIVIGAGNFWRGRQGNDMDRSVADHMGMLATMINCLAIKDVFEHLGMKAEVLSALSMPKIAQLFTKEAAIDAMENGKILILGCGTGNPYFTTDTTAVLRGIEVEADICLFAKNVDGVYTADPKKDPNAKKYDRISYGEMLEKDLKVIDAAAAALCRDNDMPVLIFDLGDGSNIEKATAGEQIGTVLY